MNIFIKGSFKNSPLDFSSFGEIRVRIPKNELIELP